MKAQSGVLYTVNHNGDTVDASVGDGVCSDSNGNCTLRAAIEEANSDAAQDVVNFSLPTPSTIDLTLGELAITANIYIVGPGARNLTVRRSTGFTNGVNNDQVSDNNAVNPLLGDLADNGGQTDTRALLDDSPAIERGNNCVTTGVCPQPAPQGFRLMSDQRGGNLRQGGSFVDLGAFERQTSVIGVSSSLGAFGFRNRSGGILLTLTKASTNEKQYRVTNPFGNFVFENIGLQEVYILERKAKRFGLSGLIIFDFDSLPAAFPNNSTLEREGIKISFDK